MLPIYRKISRLSFPDSRTPALSWTGAVLRIRGIKKNNKQTKIAVIVSKKHFRTKITRNYFKRIVFSILEKKLSILDTSGLEFLLVFPAQHTQGITYAAVASDIETFLGVIKK